MCARLRCIFPLLRTAVAVGRIAKQLIRSSGLACENGPYRYVVVPLDQGGLRPDTIDHTSEQAPHVDGYWGPMFVDQKPVAGIVPALGEPGEVYFSDMHHRKAIEIFVRIESMIDGRYLHVVDIEKQPASGPLDNLAQKIDFRASAVGYRHVRSRIVERRAAAQRRLRLIDVLAHARKRCFVLRDRQEVVEVSAIV